MLSCIRKSTTSKSKEIVLPLYRGLVRPHMKYVVQFWLPFLRKDIDLLVKVQHRVTKMIHEILGLDYEERYGGFKFELRWSYKRAWVEVREISLQQGG